MIPQVIIDDLKALTPDDIRSLCERAPTSEMREVTTENGLQDQIDALVNSGQNAGILRWVAKHAGVLTMVIKIYDVASGTLR